MNEQRTHAYQGSEWAEHEDFLVGNRVGLERLRSAIDEALEESESKIDSGEFVGVRCIDSEFFEKDYAAHTNTVGSKIGFALIGMAFLITFFTVWLATTN